MLKLNTLVLIWNIDEDELLDFSLNFVSEEYTTAVTNWLKGQPATFFRRVQAFREIKNQLTKIIFEFTGTSEISEKELDNFSKNFLTYVMAKLGITRENN